MVLSVRTLYWSTQAAELLLALSDWTAGCCSAREGLNSSVDVPCDLTIKSLSENKVDGGEGHGTETTDPSSPDFLLREASHYIEISTVYDNTGPGVVPAP